MSMRLVHLLYVFLLQASLLSAQNPVFTNYGVKDGFPSSEVYHSIQDSKGYMWFATDRGVVRFDGYEFKVFTTQDGLLDNVVFKMFEDHTGKIWFATSSMQLSYIENNRIIAYKYNDRLSGFSSGNTILQIHVDSSFSVHLFNRLYGHISIDQSGNVDLSRSCQNCSRWIRSEKQSDTLFQAIFTIEDSHYRLRKIASGVFNACSIEFPELDTTYRFPSDNKVVQSSALYTVVSPDKSAIYFNINSKIFKINLVSKELSLFHTAQGELIYMHADNQTLWISTFSRGLMSIDKSNRIIKANILNGLTATSFTKDLSGGIWITTLENGVYYAVDFDNSTYSELGFTSNHIRSLNGHQNTVVFGTKSGEITSLNSQGDKKLIWKSKTEREIRDLIKDSLAFFGISSSLVKFTLFGVEMDQFLSSSAPLGTLLFPERVLGCGQNITALPYRKHETIGHTDYYYVSDKLELLDTAVFCRCMAGKTESDLYIGKLNGLYRYVKHDSGYKHHYFGDKHISLSKNISSIQYRNQDLVVGTKGYGVTILSRNDIVNLTKADGLVSDQISRIYVDDYNNIWLATNKGVNFIDTNLNVKKIGQNVGLISDEVTSIYRYKNKVWFGTKNGLHKFSTSILNLPPSPNQVVIQSIIDASNTSLDINKTIDLAYDKSSLVIKVATFNYKLKTKVRYRYRIKELGKNWLYSNSNLIQLNHVPIGEYTLEIQSENEIGEWSTESTTLSINVEPPFWKTTWFIVLVIVLSFGSVFFFFFIRSRIKQRQNKLLYEINTYQQQALASQMNPHFIFNSLNSIQSFIAQNERKLSNHYLARFAKLMRITLDNSRKSEITIDEELSALEMYLELESIRYKNFEYVFKIDEHINTNIALIPPLLIQPLVENAIWHGLMHKTEKGKLIVEMSVEDDKIKCCVEDNGVGRQYKTTKLSDKSHESLSTAITNKRLELLSSQISEKYQLNVTDLVDAHNNPTGTRVCFYIPFKQHTEHE